MIVVVCCVLLPLWFPGCLLPGCWCRGLPFVVVCWSLVVDCCSLVVCCCSWMFVVCCLVLVFLFFGARRRLFLVACSLCSFVVRGCCCIVTC